jgi:hypothetical protein
LNGIRVVCHFLLSKLFENHLDELRNSNALQSVLVYATPSQQCNNDSADPS